MVMKKEKSNKTQFVGIRFTPEEYEKIDRERKATTCRTSSEYFRKHLLGKPITINYRDQTLDEYLSQIIRLRGELNILISTYNESLKMRDSNELIPEYTDWFISSEQQRKSILYKVDEIKNHILKVAEKWLQ
jgi:hypothetical protein